LRSISSTLRFIAKHPLSSKRPAAAFFRYVRWQIESRLRREVEFSWIEGSKLVVRNGMTGATGNIYCGLHEFADMAFLLHLLRPGDLFVDVGANIGSYTVLAAGACGANAVSAEPDPGTMRSLKRNIEANGFGSRVTLVEAAAGSAPGVALLTTGHDAANRIVKQAGAETREVEVRTLDAILEGHHPILIKIDVENYEPEVIAGAVQTLRAATLLAVLIETVDPGIRAEFEAAGFCQASYEPYSRALQPIACGAPNRLHNSLFIRDFEACRKRVAGAARRSIFGQSI
jgi:FkbM family methyltransferase